jgi:hypothetical protein
LKGGLAERHRLEWRGPAGEKQLQRVTLNEGNSGCGINRIVVSGGCEFDSSRIRD